MQLDLTAEEATYLRTVLAADIDRINDNVALVAADARTHWERERSWAKAILTKAERPLSADKTLAPADALDLIESNALVSALRDRGAVVSVWTTEDLDFLDEEEGTEALTGEQLELLKQKFLAEFGGKLADALGSDGNEALAGLRDLWKLGKDALLAEVQTSDEAGEGDSLRSSIDAPAPRD